MTARSETNQKQQNGFANTRAATGNYYQILGVAPTASPMEIRRMYRQLSKQYHPDTTDLPTATAKEKFQQLNEAYATLSNPQRRLAYDRQLYAQRLASIYAAMAEKEPPVERGDSAYIDPIDRPLSGGELFSLFLLGTTILACLLLAIVVGLTQQETTTESLESLALVLGPGFCL
ncbi:J domain-containing protein [Geitlerinema sp. PCC 9228]|uniref:J domain-containing protein n=1 Tax=Geitlerinema sp. PCC 9228 TaxID=111611 RepID=UPI0008F9C1C5|nr:J domain-containing protein [Geitlerinema sp. PCC 9228]